MSTPQKNAYGGRIQGISYYFLKIYSCLKVFINLYKTKQFVIYLLVKLTKLSQNNIFKNVILIDINYFKLQAIQDNMMDDSF